MQKIKAKKIILILFLMQLFICSFGFSQNNNSSELIAENAFQTFVKVSSYLFILIPFLLIIFSLILNLIKPYILKTIKNIELVSNANAYWTVYILFRDIPLFIYLAIGFFNFISGYHIGTKSYATTFIISTIIILIVMILKNIFDVDENPVVFWVSVGLIFVSSILCGISYIQLLSNF